MAIEELGTCTSRSDCGSQLLVRTYWDKNGDPQGAVFCPRCDGSHLWPKRKKK